MSFNFNQFVILENVSVLDWALSGVKELTAQREMNKTENKLKFTLSSIITHVVCAGNKSDSRKKKNDDNEKIDKEMVLKVVLLALLLHQLRRCRELKTFKMSFWRFLKTN